MAGRADSEAFGSRRRWTSALAVSVLPIAALVFLVVGAPTGAAARDGNNGTVKTHEGAGETDPITRNEPHVCGFHLHFLNGDPGWWGRWQIRAWPPSDGARPVVLSGTYLLDAGGQDREPGSGAYSLPNGHYKLYWDGDLGKHPKQKVFWVDCPEGGAGDVAGPSPGASPTGGTLPEQTAGPGPSQAITAEQPVGSSPPITLPPTDTGRLAAPTGTAWHVPLAGLAGVLVAGLAGVLIAIEGCRPRASGRRWR